MTPPTLARVVHFSNVRSLGPERGLHRLPGRAHRRRRLRGESLGWVELWDLMTVGTAILGRATFNSLR